MNDEVVKQELAKPAEMMRLAMDVAGVCALIVQNTAVNIKGKKYVKVEGWQSIATAHGCVAGARDVERTETGWKAVGELRRVSDGALIATAEGFVGDDEQKWAEGKEYAARAMAQTRSISRVCRSAFAHVVVLIDKDLSTTPAEEVPYEGFDNHKSKVVLEPKSAFQKTKEQMVQKVAEKRAIESVQGGEEWKNVICTYGKKDGTIRGKKLGQIAHMSDVMDHLYQKFVQDLKVVKEADQPLRDGLIAWKVWQLEQAEKLKQFKVAKSWEMPMDDPMLDQDEDDIDYTPTDNKPYTPGEPF